MAGLEYNLKLQQPSQTPSVAPNNYELETLPVETMKQLRNAAIIGDIDELYNLSEALKKNNQALAVKIKSLADELEFELITSLLN